jgi:hypothetical protein
MFFKYTKLSIFVILVLLFTGAVYSIPCPYFDEEPTTLVNYSLSSNIDCIKLSIDFSCFTGTNTLTISNIECTDILIYTSGDGVEHELYPFSTKEAVRNMSLDSCLFDSQKSCTSSFTCLESGGEILEKYSCLNEQVCCSTPNKIIESYKGRYEEINIPLENDAEWTRSFYFKSNPNDEIIINAFNLPATNVNKKTGYGYLIYIVGGIILLFLLIVFYLKKRNS